MVRKREVYATAFILDKQNRKSKSKNKRESYLQSLYFFTFPSVTKQFCSMGMYWYNFQITAFSV